MTNYTQLVSINFQGMVVVFGRSTAPDDSAIYFNVLGIDPSIQNDELDWTGFRKVEFPDQVREAGMGLITLKKDAYTLTPSSVPFRVVTDQKYICVVQQSALGTLIVNRFRLLKESSGDNQRTTKYSLSPAWEVRFSRSGKEDVPQDKSDAQTYLNPDGRPFFEPSIELAMIDQVANGAFDVVLLPGASGRLSWQFMTVSDAGRSVSLTNLPSGENGLFSLESKRVSKSGRIEPDSTFSLLDPDGSTLLPITGAPQAALYVKHEKVIQPDGSSIGVKRASRVMIALPVTVGKQAIVATIDTAVSASGTMARLEGALTSSSVKPAPFDLALDGYSALRFVPPNGKDNPLAISGAYSMRLMVSPSAKSDGATLISGDPKEKPSSAAPYMRVVDGDKIEVGFGDGTNAVACRTLLPVLATGTWTRVEVSYRGAGANPFVVTINGATTAVTDCTADADPQKAPITTIGSEADGFAGAINNLEIDAAGVNVVKLACEDVDYSVSPPTTPNAASSGIAIQVFGARLQPTTAPVDVDMSGQFHIDGDGLTYYVGLASFLRPQQRSCLMEGSDGLLHFYYGGADDLLSVAQFNKESARSTFALDWSTNWKSTAVRAIVANAEIEPNHYLELPVAHWALVNARVMAAPDATQTGSLALVAHRVGTYMNETKITVGASAISSLLCDITVQAPGNVGTEKWRGLPRNVEQLARIWNGAGASDPDDPAVLRHSRPYYDYAGAQPAVVAPMKDESGGYFIVTSVPLSPLKLAALAVKAGRSSEFVDIDIEVAAPPHWQPQQRITQHWPNAPVKPQPLMNLFLGTATGYDYGSVNTTGSRAYGLPLALSRSDDQTNYVRVFVRDELKDFTLTIADASLPSMCKVTVCGIDLKDVPRDQTDFVSVLNGDDPDYKYPAGYKSNLTPQIFLIGNGLSSDLRNLAVAPPVAGALAYAGLIRFLYCGTAYDATAIAPLSSTAAAILQGAVLSRNQRDDVLLRGSVLFGAVNAEPPSNGGVGRTIDTASHSRGLAPLRTPGINGGWMLVPPNFSLGFNATAKQNYVGFKVDKAFSPSDHLAIDSDLTLQAWLVQDSASKGKLSRAITYNIVGNRQNPNLPISMMIGARQGPGLIIGTSTNLTSSFNFSPPDLTIQIYIYLKVADARTPGTILSIAQVMGSTEFLSLNLNSAGKAELNFMSGAAVVTSVNPLPTAKWTCLTGVVEDAGSGKVSLKLYIDAGSPQGTTAANKFSGKLGALTIGSKRNAGVKASVNGVAFWQRALAPPEVQNSVTYGFADNDDLLGIRWNLAEGEGTTVMNSAATGSNYDTQIINPMNPSWDENGAFFVPYAGRNDLVIASNRILKGWTHVALASRQGHGLKLSGGHSGKVADGSNFKPGPSFCVEAWVSPNTANKKQVIAEKPGSWSLAVNSLGQISLRVTLKQDSGDSQVPPTTVYSEVVSAIPAGKTTYVCVNFITGSVGDETGSKDYVKQLYYTTATLYVNGINTKQSSKVDYKRALNVSVERSSFYVGVAGENTFNFEGLISHIRVWNRVRTGPEIAETYALRSTPVDRDGLTAGWDFDDMVGTVAKDMTGSNDLQLTSNQLWTIWQDVAQLDVYVNGARTISRTVTPDSVGGYQDLQFTFGGAINGTNLTSPFIGGISAVSLFSTLLTEQQVRESMNTPLSGNEAYLAASWAVDAGSGAIVYDLTGRGNNGAMLPIAGPPIWRPTAAPIQNEAQVVVNALGGRTNQFVTPITDQPSVVEYAAGEKDAYGQPFSVLKRGYFFQASSGRTELRVGYKAGDLDTIFVGQVQSKPSIVGYIEGGPPIPSENQTLAYWVGDGGGPARSYAGISTVSYQESDTRTWSFSAAQSSTFNGAFNIKGGFYLKSKTDVSAGLGLEAGTQMAETKLKFGAKMTLSGDLGTTDQVSQSHSNTMSLTSSLSPMGRWEAPDAILNPAVGRRYIQNNIGIAIVKSATADLYMMALKSTQTAVGYFLLPNTTIPVDTNIIDFPINPRYVKNGTLDGKVGLLNDPDYPGANLEPGSYFKPVEAYALKRKIEKEEQQIKAYFDQFDVSRYRLLGSYSGVADKLKENSAYDFASRRNLRSMYNNYVWTAAGGMHREEYSVANTYSETFVGASSLKFALGLEFNGDFGTAFGGYYLEADAMLGNTWTMTATKSQSAANSFRLNCNVIPTDFLCAPILNWSEDGQLKFGGYQNEAAPGKVDAYRFMSFLLAPSSENFSALNTIVDPNWLNNSSSAAANAMREGLSAPSEPWRVLYRTTFVSRVPAPFQPVKDDADAPNVTAPANMPSNAWLIALISREVAAPRPTPLEIGTAIDALLGAPGQSAGKLKDLVPWWGDFYAAAKVYGTNAFDELANLRSDLLDYMIAKYTADTTLHK